MLSISVSALLWFHVYCTHRKQKIAVNDIFPNRLQLQVGYLRIQLSAQYFYYLYATSWLVILRIHCVQFHMYSDDCQLYIMDNVFPPDDL